MKVQVAYGRIDATKFDNCPRCSGSGIEFGSDCPFCKGSGKHANRAFTYRSNLDLEVGDVVEVPPTWLDELYGNHEFSKEATVVRLGSDYDGQTVSILGVIERAGATQ